MPLPTLRVDPRTYDPAHMASGELDLVADFLERGISDFLGRDLLLPCKAGSKATFLAFKLRLLAAEWIYDVDDHGPWSFEWSCSLCEISAERLRTELQPLMVSLVNQYRAFTSDLAIEIRRKQRAKGERTGKPLTPRQQAGLEKKRARDRRYYAALTPEEKEARAARKQAAKDRWVARRSKARAKARTRREAKGRIDRACKR